MICCRSLLALLLVMLAAANAAAQRGNRAYTDPAQADEDFAFQGEYLGDAVGGFWQSQLLGLQVIALGESEFTARLLRGGLPGAGWDRRNEVELSGQRQGQRLQLGGVELVASVDGSTAWIQSTGDAQLGRLRKIRRISPTQGAAPPPRSLVLFDGRPSSYFEDESIDDQGLLEVGTRTSMPVRDFFLHLEFRTPFMPQARGQGRGNSGVYIQQRYEVQILDSFGLAGVENECGSLYRQKAPDVNMCLPPLSWQTYDIAFVAARFDSQGNRQSPARITVLHNGEPVQDRYAILDKTGAGRPEGPQPLPILLQNHRDPVRFRNIWMIDATPATLHPEYLPVSRLLDCGSCQGQGYSMSGFLPARSRLPSPCWW